MDELHNSDGVWVRLSPDTLAKLNHQADACSSAGAASSGAAGPPPLLTEGWCLQYNQHLDKTLMVPVTVPEGEPLATADDKPPAAAHASQQPQPFNTEPLLRPIKPASSSSSSSKRKSVTRGPGNYTVTKCGVSGHNIRSSPHLSAPPIGMINLGDVVAVVQVRIRSCHSCVRAPRKANIKFTKIMLAHLGF